MRRGALLHDIGKMALPDRVLLKAGPLDDEEKEVIRRHPQHAYEMLAGIPFLEPALDIPWAHHERWDGDGSANRVADHIGAESGYAFEPRVVEALLRVLVRRGELDR